MPQAGRAEMNVVQVDEPQLVVMLHFMTPFMAVQPIFESPLARPQALQRTMASQLLIDLLRDRPGAHGLLLASIEQDGNDQNFFFCYTPVRIRISGFDQDFEIFSPPYRSGFIDCLRCRSGFSHFRV